MWETVLNVSIVAIILIILILAIAYFVNLKNLKGRKEHFKAIHENLKIGKKVEVLNGIYGEVARLTDETIDLKIKSGQVIEVSRYAVTKIIK